MKPHPNKNFCISNFNSVPRKAWGGGGSRGLGLSYGLRAACSTWFTLLRDDIC